MPKPVAYSLLAIMAAAVLAPLLSELVKRFRIPSVLFELGLGILFGPQVLGFIHLSSFVTSLSSLGLAFLFYTAGFELDWKKLQGSALNHAAVGWGASLALGLVVGGILYVSGFVISSLLVGLCLTTTALGTLLPMMLDRDLTETSFGRFLFAAGAAGEFGPVVAVTVLLGASSPAEQALLLGGFVVLALLVALFASRPQPPKVMELLHKHLTTSTQLPVRIVVLLITAMVALAAVFGLDILLGAFASGMIVRMALSEQQAEEIMPKTEAIGFGFLIPVFFIISGAKFDIASIEHKPAILYRLAIFLGLLLVVRGLPALVIYWKTLPMRQRTALVFLQSTALPLIVVITEIGISTHKMLPVNATALVGAGMASVLLYPLIGFAIMGEQAVMTKDALEKLPVREF